MSINLVLVEDQDCHPPLLRVMHERCRLAARGMRIARVADICNVSGGALDGQVCCWCDRSLTERSPVPVMQP